MYKVAIIEKIHPDGIKLFEEHKDFYYEIIEDSSENNLIKKLPEFDALTLRTTNLFSNILDNCKKMKVISRHGVGTDNVDLAYLKRRNIALLITATANAISVAEHVFGMMLSLTKGVADFDEIVRNGYKKDEISKIDTYELFNKRILIIGFGRTGQSLISRCIGFGMKINVYDPYVGEDVIKKAGGTKTNSLDEGLKIADFISIHSPLTKETKNLINKDNMKIMKKNSILINTARGGIINELDLNQALNENIIFRAGLDVFEKEPINLDNPLINNKKVLLSPHAATFTKECTAKMGIQTAQNIIDFYEGNLSNKMKVNL
jgi:D-3-phosphoglycerate dehydrogenase / 2-oxoglutarate reductase|tara:strand:+ start:1528 stop:2484 length:957 start_codon:yes stop_codon:yes gene_type:complete